MAQDTLEGLCLSASLGMHWASPRGAGGGVWGKGSLGISAESAGPRDETCLTGQGLSEEETAPADFEERTCVQHPQTLSWVTDVTWFLPHTTRTPPPLQQFVFRSTRKHRDGQQEACCFDCCLDPPLLKNEPRSLKIHKNPKQKTVTTETQRNAILSYWLCQVAKDLAKRLQCTLH
ncbi:hypothetical protein ILYODFUR_013344 [Ilyodon furcidens]|uniref:Uncharacterized protein n=1 Tax=Ilyodon furcidens TaxID=33524 RepID=A0ABV0VEY2_9TELE